MRILIKRWLFLWIILSIFFITMCVPPSSGPEDNTAAEQAKLDSLRQELKKKTPIIRHIPIKLIA